MLRGPILYESQCGGAYHGLIYSSEILYVRDPVHLWSIAYLFPEFHENPAMTFRSIKLANGI